MAEQSRSSHRSSLVKKLLFKTSSCGKFSGVSFSVLALSRLDADCMCNEACLPACLPAATGLQDRAAVENTGSGTELPACDSRIHP